MKYSKIRLLVASDADVQMCTEGAVEIFNRRYIARIEGIRFENRRTLARPEAAREIRVVFLHMGIEESPIQYGQEADPEICMFQQTVFPKTLQTSAPYLLVKEGEDGRVECPMSEDMRMRIYMKNGERINEVAMILSIGDFKNAGLDYSENLVGFFVLDNPALKTSREHMLVNVNNGDRASVNL